jgi:hypothetical protein
MLTWKSVAAMFLIVRAHAWFLATSADLWVVLVLVLSLS